MDHSYYEQIRQLARRQAIAVADGDVDEAVRLLDERAVLLARAGEPGAADAEAIRETLRLDRDLSGALRQRMISLREEAVQLQRSRTAVAGYRAPNGRPPRMLDTER